MLGAPHSLIEPAATSCADNRRSRELLSVFVGDTSPSVDPRLYLASVGQCTLAYAELISGVLELAESVRLKERQQKASSGDFEDGNNFSPYCRPSCALLETGCIPERLLEGNGSDPELRERLSSSVSLFLKNYVQCQESTRGRQCHSVCPSDPLLKANAHRPSCPPLLPLIANTHGWVVGLGWQLVEAIGGLGWVTHPIELLASQDWRMRQKTCSRLAVCESLPSDEPSNGIHWGPIETRLKISNPFVDLIEEFRGRLPLTLNHVRLLPCAFRHITPVRPPSCQSNKAVAPKHLRWLRFMAAFNVAYGHAVHFPIATPEGQTTL